MQRPTRIAAVTATTALLMTAAAASVFSIQQAVAGAVSTDVITAEAPVLVAQSPADVDPAAVLGSLSDAPALPPIPNVKLSATKVATQAQRPTRTQRSTGTAARTSHARQTASATPTARPTHQEHEDAASAQQQAASSEQEREAAKQAAEKAREAAKQAAEQSHEQQGSSQEGEHQDD